MRLSPAAWRTLYNVADALRPVPDDEVVVDLARWMEPAPPGEAALRVLIRTLAWLELETRLLRAPTRGFSWLPREARWERLAVWERSRCRWRRRAFQRLVAVVDAALDRVPHSLPGA